MGRGEGKGTGRGKGKGYGSSSSSSGGKKKRKQRVQTTTTTFYGGGAGGYGGYGMAAGAGAMAGAGMMGAGMMGRDMYSKGPYNQYDQMYYDYYNKPYPHPETQPQIMGGGAPRAHSAPMGNRVYGSDPMYDLYQKPFDPRGASTGGISPNTGMSIAGAAAGGAAGAAVGASVMGAHQSGGYHLPPQPHHSHPPPQQQQQQQQQPTDIQRQQTHTHLHPPPSSSGSQNQGYQQPPYPPQPQYQGAPSPAVPSPARAPSPSTPLVVSPVPPRAPSPSSSRAPSPTPTAPPCRAIILDNGTYRCKVGFSGEDQPRDVFPTLAGRPKHTQVMAGAIDGKDIFLGFDAQDKRGMLILTYPIENGRICHWDDMHLVWSHAINNSLRVDGSLQPILVTEPPLNPTKDRERMAQILFEMLNVPALFIANTATLSLYSLGLTTGLVVELGHGVCHIVPVYQGYTISNAIIRIDLGGRNVTDYLKHLLNKSGYNFTTTAEHEVVEHIKYQLAYVSQDPQAETNNFLIEQVKEYEMPDGQKIKVAQERFWCTEVFFNPSLLGKETKGLPDLIKESVDKCEINIRTTLLSNIVMGGGSTLFPGLEQRLLKEVKGRLPAGVEVKINAPNNRLFSTWHGGATLASSPAFQSLWITREQWQSMGPACLHQKCYQ